MVTRFRIGLVFTVLSLVLLSFAAASWFFNPNAPSTVFGISSATPDAASFARLVAIFKGLLDLFPVLLIIPLMIQRNWRGVGWALLVAFLLIPVVDFFGQIATSPNVSISALAIHLPFAIALGGGTLCLLTLRLERH